MTDQPTVTITALGNSGSGKTTFLLGMYGIMSAGLQGYFLNAPNPDVDLQLSGMWEKLLEDGALPPPNLADITPYSFVFSDGIKQLLAVNWLDYRGGALDDLTGTTSEDVPKLHERLKRSDSVYLVLDGKYLAKPVDGSTKPPIMVKAGLRRMSSLLQTAVQARDKLGAPPPSLVVLITKADLIPRERRQHLNDDLVADVRELLDIAFSEGLSTLICPVQLGDFGLAPAETVKPGEIAPRALHLPLIFSIAEYMGRLSAEAARAASQSQSQSQSLEAQVAALRTGALAFIHRGARRAAEAKLAHTAQERDSLTDVQKNAAERADRLFRELSGVPRFRDGFEVVT